MREGLHTLNMAEETTRRDFISVATGVTVTIGVVVIAWTLIGSMAPSAEITKEKLPIADLSEIQEGEQKIVLLRGDPVLIRHRTPDEIIAIQNIDLNLLHYPEKDSERIRLNMKGEKDARYTIIVFLCPWERAIPQSLPDYHRKWFCQKSTARFDSSGRAIGRVKVENMKVPNYRYLSNTKIELIPELTPAERVMQKY